ncbi:para-aminobenzoate synthetase / 4-amino-4-deoxychorismate lyase [Friedmanniella luteola]|uniref:Para-aminobenzoate synthetase / 4-amino-4-deoxychorismate lyase n=1 Tax=Friedmanniella luteola TaxID=546871 RepID=A0A1H1TZW1_9ACTN|nr:chorismate-binding protein [Friedmanniella luteola]SDS65733.1 para-aminobenzoate synthetase / 4-amino-4-deoxychorismate lyase [Friedmanniella luteola]
MRPEPLDPGTWTARPAAVALAGGCPPSRLVARLRAADRPAVLSGDWFGGGVLVLRRPLLVREPADAADGFDDLVRLPAVTAPPLGGPDVLGGGWVTTLGFSPGTTVLAFHGSLLRWRVKAGWTFETLGLPGHEEADAAELEAWRADLAAAEDDGDDGGRGAAAPDLGVVGTREPPEVARDRHLAAVEDAVGRIRRGDFYQVNLGTRGHGRYAGEPARLFARVVERLQPDRAALVTGPGGRALACFSPEVFWTLHDGRVTSSPIKGTAPRRAGETDSPALRGSAKDAAENVMIVDLVRHDLAQVSEPGSVAVPELLALRPHPGVWHLVSTVTSRLAPGVDVADLLRATFPPGSVTGAPKTAALAALPALEPVPRGAHTGAVGLVTPARGTELAVTIRSFELADGGLELGVGGGITTDSVPVLEWYECWHKAAPLVEAAGGRLDPALPRSPVPPTPGQRASGVFESVLAVRGRPLRLAAHLARLDLSTRELYGQGLPADLPDRVQLALAEVEVEARAAVRVAVRPAVDGSSDRRPEVEITVRPLGARLERCTLRRAERPAVSWRHKWVDRAALSAAEVAVAPALPYFVGEPATGVTESSRGNLFARGPDGVWRTPPLDEHLLPGVTRREVLDLLADLGEQVRVARLVPADLQAADAVVWTSSLSGVVAVTAVDGRPLPAPPALVATLNRRLGV